LKPKQEKSKNLFGIPENITQDNGGPNNSGAWHEFANEKTLKPMLISPDQTEANGVC